MCGGDLEIANGATVGECEYCGTKQTVPNVKDDNLENLFNRANSLRINGDFDKAAKIFEKIIESDTTQSEAYWGLVLCKYGIEYVDDPTTYKKVPTCHRASYEPITADDDYKSAIENADMRQRILYEEQAKEIDEIQKQILSLSQKEEKYDIFICYKETDSDGKKTQDSTIANDIYHKLTEKGYKVFYAAITLEGKLGSAYEPIIFAALTSAKVMLSLGTKPEYFNAVWVKNEWSRFLKIIKKDRSKLLIPCYRDMDPYHLPEEFAHLQAQDMSKIGFMQDIIHGIEKIIPKEDKIDDKHYEAQIAPLLKRVFMFLEDGGWKSADEYCEKILDINPECAEAYLGKLLAELRVNKKERLKDYSVPFSARTNYGKVIRFGDEKLKNELISYNKYIEDRNEKQKQTELNKKACDLYKKACELMDKSRSVNDYVTASKAFDAINSHDDSAEKKEDCLKKIKEFEAKKEKCNKLLSEFKTVAQKEKNNAEKKEKNDKEISRLDGEHKKLLLFKEELTKIENENSSIDEKIKSAQFEIASLNSEKSKLGVFSSKEKKEINERLSSLEDNIKNWKKDKEELSKKRNGYNSVSDLNIELEKLESKINEQKKALGSSDMRSSDEIRTEMEQIDYGKILLKRYDIINSLKKGDFNSFGNFVVEEANLIINNIITKLTILVMIVRYQQNW